MLIFILGMTQFKIIMWVSASPTALTISGTTPDGPAAFPFLINLNSNESMRVSAAFWLSQCGFN